jgi:hypothetical protein
MKFTKRRNKSRSCRENRELRDDFDENKAKGNAFEKFVILILLIHQRFFSFNSFQVRQFYGCWRRCEQQPGKHAKTVKQQKTIILILLIAYLTCLGNGLKKNHLICPIFKSQSLFRF